MSYTTTDLSDAHPELPTSDPVFRDFGGRPLFHGPIETVQTNDDNVLVRATLETPGLGRVLVVDNGGSTRTALLGDILAKIGIENGWSGVIINGCLRDSIEVGCMAIGIKALGAVPRRSTRNGIGEVGATVSFAGLTFTPGHYLYADPDGILISPSELAPTD
jgi:regulator of ribonuclease activity A